MEPKTTELTGWTIETEADMAKWFERFESGELPDPEPITLGDGVGLTVDEMFDGDGLEPPANIDAFKL
jgi:hypothetical protein